MCCLWFSGEIRAGDLISALSMLIAASALFLNWWQARKTSIQRRGDYIAGLFSRYLDDPDTADIFYRLEYGTFRYSERVHNTPDEIKLDKLLTNYDRIATLYEMGTFAFEDLKYMEYEFLNIYENESIQSYFTFLDAWYAERGVPGGAFPAFRRVAKVLRERKPQRRAEKA